MSTAHERPSQPLAVVFRQSVIGNLLNPKVTLFFYRVPAAVRQSAWRAECHVADV
ncbi:MAG: hypothetical protein CBARDMAM_0863 [uncultured Caballeronia sp.]|nr:MAG: hypothetical protein CBARDMAM_0863 [uncultured Caballeronia sp.]